MSKKKKFIIVIIILAMVVIGIMKFFNMEIAVSEKRNPEVVSVPLSENMTLKSWGAVYIKFGNSHFFPSSFCIESNDVVVYIDPIIIKETKPADYIFITHSHTDHFSIEDIKKISDQDTVIICPKNMTKRLKGLKVKEVRPEDTLELNGIKCEVLPAYSLGFPSHPKLSRNVGYVLTIDNMRIYHAGDTDLINEIKTLKNIDVALVPIDGGNLTMKTKEAAELINTIKPRVAIPMHYVVEMNKTNEFEELIDKDIEVITFAK